MEGRENARVKATRKRLADALMGMLREMPIHAVSIRELCIRAGINRTTFYHHYTSQYDLLEDICRHFLREISDRLAEADPENQESVQEQIALVLVYIEQHLEASRLLLNNQIAPNVAVRLFSLPKVTAMLDIYGRNCEDPQLRRSAVSFAIYGSYRLLKEWLNAEEAERLPPEQEAALMLTLARRVFAL